MPSAKKLAYDPRTLLTHRALVFSNTLGKGAVRLYAGQYGIPLAEWRLLALLVSAGPATVNGLANSLGTDKGWISRTAAALVAKRLAGTKVAPDDGRSFLIAVTPAGRALYERILPAALKRHQALVSVLSEQELKTFEALLGRLQSQAEAIADGAEVLATQPKARAVRKVKPTDVQSAARRKPKA